MKLKILLFMSIVMIFTASSLLAKGPIIFSNPYDPNSTDAFSSVNWDGTDYFQSYADYYYNNAFTLTDFHWWGAGNAGVPIGFEINFYENTVADLPGVEIYSQWVDYGDANAELVGNNSNYFLDVYKYSIDFNPRIFGWDSGIYWISVMAHTESPAENWFWAIGTNDHWNEDVQFDYSTGGYTGNPGPDHADFAFQITAVPEPATLTLFGLGLLGSALARRRRNKK